MKTKQTVNKKLLNLKPVRQQESQHRKKILFVFLFIGLLVFIGIYCFKAMQYDDRYFPNTKFNGIDIGNKTYTEALKKIDEKTEDYTLTLNLNGKAWQKINVNDVNNKKDCERLLKQNLKKQDTFSWPKAYFEQTTITFPSAIDSTKVDQRLSDIKMDLVNYNANQKSATNACLTIKDGKAHIVPGKNGTKIQVNLAMSEIKKALYEHKAVLNLNDYVMKPNITADSPKLKEDQEKVEAICAEKVEYQMNGKTVTIPSQKIAEWLILNEHGEVDLDKDKVYAFMTKFAEKNTPTDHNYRFHSTESGEVKVPFESYTWTINVDKETPALIQDILKGKDVQRTPITNGAASPKGKIIGDTYVEVDLAKQKLFIYEKGKKVLSTNVVTGKPSSPTPIGVQYVWKKERNAVLRGPGYASPVAYWMPIDWTGVGLHDANWQPAFGGNLYREGYGSHGCVNISPAVMPQVYNTVAVGTPVLVFNGNETPAQQKEEE